MLSNITRVRILKQIIQRGYTSINLLARDGLSRWGQFRESRLLVRIAKNSRIFFQFYRYRIIKFQRPQFFLIKTRGLCDVHGAPRGFYGTGPTSTLQYIVYTASRSRLFFFFNL